MLLRMWRELFPPHILHRGQTYFEEGAVDSIHRSGDLVEATVLGSELYRVEIGLENGKVADWTCNCPYGADGTPCKHLAAVLYELEGMERESPDEPFPNREDLKTLVERLDLPTARALLLRLAAWDEKTADLLRLAVEPPSEGQVELWKQRIDRLIQQAGDLHGYIDYDRAWDAMCELDDLLTDAAEEYLSCGHTWEAFALTGYALQAAAGCNMDDSDGGLSMIFETCTALWQEQVAAASPEERGRMYRWLQDAALTAPDLCREQMLKAKMTLFHEPEFLQENIRQLDRMIGNQLGRDGNRFDALPQLVLWRLDCAQALGEPQQALETLEKKFWDIPEVRERVIRRLRQEGRQEEAAALLRESKELDRQWPGLVEKYSEELIALYEEAGQRERLLEELQFQVFQCGQQNLTYVKKLKSLIGPDQWPELRERLLAGKTLYGDLGEQLLEMDGLYERLMERVARLESLYSLDRWEAVLLPRFPEQVREAYRRCLDERMRLAGNRRQYAAVIAYLKKLRSPDGTDRTLAENWRMAYPRRRSMLEELEKAGY